MAILDQQTVTVADVISGAEPAGHIGVIEFWNPMTGAWVATAPANVPEGSLIGIHVIFQNDLGVTQNMGIDVLVTPPAASPYTITGGLVPVDGAMVQESTTTWVADETGTWQATVTLNGEIA